MPSQRTAEVHSRDWNCPGEGYLDGLQSPWANHLQGLTVHLDPVVVQVLTEAFVREVLTWVGTASTCNRS